MELSGNFFLRFACPAGLLLSSLSQAGEGDRTRRLLEEGREPVRIVCLGDSITGVYYHSGGLRAYPEMLEIALRQAYPNAPVTVRNAGISGDTTKGALARLDRDVIAHHPHLVTVMFGMNDLVSLPLDDFESNLERIITRCHEAGAEVLLCTQNSVVATPARPLETLERFTRAIRGVAEKQAVGLVDCFARFEEVRAGDALAWALLHSDPIHPNMDGHKVFAAEIARVISGKAVSWQDVGPPQPALRHTSAMLKAGKPVNVLAMPPYDTLIGPALERLHPGARVTVTTWPTENKSLAELRNAAKPVRQKAPDLVLLAVPASAASTGPEDFHENYAWIMNWSLSFGPQQWDVIVAPPSTVKPDLSPAERAHEDFARRLIAAQDLNLIDRPPGDRTPLPDLLGQWLDRQWNPTQP